MTCYSTVVSNYRRLCAEYGASSVKSKVCGFILCAIFEELVRYCRRTGKPFDTVVRYACEVDLSHRRYEVTVFPYVYVHEDAYHVLDGLDTNYHKRFKDEKKH